MVRGINMDISFSTICLWAIFSSMVALSLVCLSILYNKEEQELEQKFFEG